jgi:recombination protein RecA
MYGEGISKTGEIVDLGVQAGFVEKSGAWFSAEGERIGQGRENAKTYLKEHPDMMAVLEGKIRGNSNTVAEALLVGPDASEAAEAAEVAAADEAPAERPAGKSKKAAS